MANVLIVDDDPLVLETLSSFMETANHQVLRAEDGKQALKVCRTKTPDLVIVDMIMPEMEGLETIRQLRHDLPRVKIIAISGGGSLKPKDYLDVARKLGADLALTKPCSREELLQAAEQLLSLPA